MSGQDLSFTTDLVSALPFLGQVNLPTFCAFICNSLNGGICTHHLAEVPIRTQLNPSLGNRSVNGSLFRTESAGASARAEPKLWIRQLPATDPTCTSQMGVCRILPWRRRGGEFEALGTEANQAEQLGEGTHGSSVPLNPVCEQSKVTGLEVQRAGV